MNGDAAGIDSCNTGGCNNDILLCCFPGEIIQESGFTGARLACQKNIPPGVFYDIENMLLQIIRVKSQIYNLSSWLFRRVR